MVAMVIAANNKIGFDKFPKIRNRKEHRALEKVLRHSGKSKAEASRMADLFKSMTTAWDTEGSLASLRFLQEGEHVKLNVNKMHSYPDWEKLQESYRKFVDANADTIFKVRYFEKYREEPTLVELVNLENENEEIVWLFSDQDLLVLDESDGLWKEMYLVEPEC
jgi:hypothetical protein